MKVEKIKYPVLNVFQDSNFVYVKFIVDNVAVIKARFQTQLLGCLQNINSCVNQFSNEFKGFVKNNSKVLFVNSCKLPNGKAFERLLFFKLKDLGFSFVAGV